MANLYKQYIACAKKFTQIKHKFGEYNEQETTSSDDYTNLYNEFVETLDIFEILNDKYDRNDRDVEEDRDDHSVESDKDDAEHRKQVSDLCDKEIAAADVTAKISYYENKYYNVKYKLDELKKRHYAQYDNATNLDESLRNELAKLKKEYDIMAENLDMTNGICHTLETKLSKIEAVINAR